MFDRNALFDGGVTSHENDGERRSLLRAIGGMAIASVVAGALVATAVTPLAAVTGVTMRDSLQAFASLPADIAIGDHEQRNEIYGTRDGQPVRIADVYDQNREDLTWDEVSPFLKDAAVAGEDRRYYEHGGIDPQSLTRAVFGYLTESGGSGGSTIAMQLVKNIRVSESQQLPTEEARDAAYAEAIRKSPSRKVEEMRLAISLDKRYTKKEILLAYLNLAGFGRATYGVEAASERYYSSSAKDLTLAQSASLIAIVQTPDSLNLGTPENYPANKARRDLILGNMLELGHITQAQYDEAIATPIEAYVALQDPTNGCLYATDAKFFCELVVDSVSQLEMLGATPEERQANWKRGGYKVFTSLDLNQQDVAQQQVSERAPADEARFSLGAAAVAVQPGTGRVMVMAQNKAFNNTPTATPAETSINFNTDKAFGGSGGFQTGSTYKPFTLARWLQTGHTLRESVNGSERTIPASQFKCDGAAMAGEAWPVGNDTGGQGGTQSVLSATARSVNGAYASMAQKMDICEIHALAESMGVHRADGAPLETNPSSVLGTNQIAPLSMASAYATFASGGVYCAPTVVDRIVDSEGEDLGGQAPQCSQVLEPNVAATVAYALEGVVKGGTAGAANTRDGVPLLAKTGTTDGAHQTWLIGSTTKTTIAVWVGNIKGDPAKRTTKNPAGEQSLRRVSIGGTNGASVRFVVLKAMMQSFNANPAYRGEAFPEPDAALVSGRGKTTATAPPVAVAPPAPEAPAPEAQDTPGEGSNGDKPEKPDKPR
jgi:membrane peptidoglycan carboxypeptidase